MFFDNYSRFLGTSEIAPFQGRLNLRYEAIFAANRDIFRGARVLDLASHDGRWSFAALQTGASHVTGVEARKELVENACETFRHYEVDPASYRFICGDVFDTLAQEELDIDVVLCLGYIYHTYRHTEFLYRMRELDPTYLIVDSHVIPQVGQPLVKLRVDDPGVQGDAVQDVYSYNGRVLVGLPSVSALTMMFQVYDFGLEEIYDWRTLLATHPNVRNIGDYADGWRVTMRLRSGVSNDSTTQQSAEAPGCSAPVSGSQSSHPGSHVWNGRRGRRVVNRALARMTGYELRRVRPAHQE